MMRYNSYPPEWVDFLKSNSFKMSLEELTDAFNKRFGTEKNMKTIDGWCRKHRLYSMNRYYSPEQERFLKENASRMGREALTDAFNQKFGTRKNTRAIKAWCNKRGYNAPSDGRFRDGNVSWQTGLSKEEFRAHYTEESFCRMLRPMRDANVKYKIGDETTDHGTDDPYIVTSLDYSLDFHSRMTPKGRYVWEQEYGPVPEGHCIIHLDGDRKNCDIENLACIPLRYRGILAKNRWYTDCRERTMAAILWCELYFALRGSLLEAEEHSTKTI